MSFCLTPTHFQGDFEVVLKSNFLSTCLLVCVSFHTNLTKPAFQNFTSLQYLMPSSFLKSSLKLMPKLIELHCRCLWEWHTRILHVSKLFVTKAQLKLLSSTWFHFLCSFQKLCTFSSTYFLDYFILFFLICTNKSNLCFFTGFCRLLDSFCKPFLLS